MAEFLLVFIAGIVLGFFLGKLRIVQRTEDEEEVLK